MEKEHFTLIARRLFQSPFLNGVLLWRSTDEVGVTLLVEAGQQGRGNQTDVCIDPDPFTTPKFFLIKFQVFCGKKNGCGGERVVGKNKCRPNTKERRR